MTDSINLIIEFHRVVVPVFPVLPPLELSIALIYAMNALSYWVIRVYNNILFKNPARTLFKIL